MTKDELNIELSGSANEDDVTEQFSTEDLSVILILPLSGKFYFFSILKKKFQ